MFLCRNDILIIFSIFFYYNWCSNSDKFVFFLFFKKNIFLHFFPLIFAIFITLYFILGLFHFLFLFLSLFFCNFFYFFLFFLKKNIIFYSLHLEYLSFHIWPIYTICFCSYLYYFIIYSSHYCFLFEKLLYKDKKEMIFQCSNCNIKI